MNEKDESGGKMLEKEESSGGGGSGDKIVRQRRMIGIMRIALIVAIVIILIIICVFIGVAVHQNKELAKKVAPDCPTNQEAIQLDDPPELSPFYDLTNEEVSNLREYLMKQKKLKLVPPSKIQVNKSYIFVAELNPPDKEMTINYLENEGEKPPREAKVVIFRGDKEVPDIEEYKVGPLDNITYHVLVNKIPFNFRPLTGPEFGGAITMLLETVGTEANLLLEESYGGNLTNCGQRCLAFRLITPMSPAVSGEEKRKMWFWLFHDVEYFSLHPLDFHVLVDLTGMSKEEYLIEKVVYSNKKFDSLFDLMSQYKSNTIIKTKVPFPTGNDKTFSSLNQRGKQFPSKPLSHPVEVEPDGKRYSVHGRHVKYMLWDFCFRMSTMSGPQLFDIRFDGKRIAYEISLQEIAVFYSANNPAHRFADYVDSVALIGSRAKTLVAGADCPSHATFISASHVMESSEEPVVSESAFCLFEHNTGTPLRRHHNYWGGEDKVYEGMLDVVLVLRTITTIVNYDYIMDFIFHQNGAVQVKIIPTGYILSSFSDVRQSEKRYGFQLHDNFVGNIHHHIFNVKVDMDINGRANRHETIELENENLLNRDWSVDRNAKYAQTVLKRVLKQTESETGYQYDFKAPPKYFTFYNNDETNNYNVPKAYRLLVRGMSRQVIPEGGGQEPSVSWARYQLAVTKRKETEPTSSSMYAIWDGKSPIVNFQNFLDDNEDIRDQDLVAWVTMGIHHFPHTEDLPITHTVGLDLDFFLLPYNYFPEDPAMGSSNAVRIEPHKQHDTDAGIKIQRYGVSQEFKCFVKPQRYDASISQKPTRIFEKSGADSVGI